MDAQMDPKNYYKALGLAPGASEAEIKTAFRKLARKHHPDVSSGAGAEQRFKQISEAYDVLGDPEKRAAYDRGETEPGAADRPPPGWQEGFSFTAGPGGAQEFEDLFGSMFRGAAGGMGGMGGTGAGMGMGAGRDGRGADSHGQVEIALEDAFHGATRTLSLQTPELGQDGRLRLVERSVSVQVPKGVREGQHIRLKGKGAMGLGQGAAGDLFLEIRFAPHPVYRPEGRDLHMELPVSPWEAGLGTELVLPTPGGKVELRIPRNARSGQTLRLRGKGLPGMPGGAGGAQAGDLYAHLRLVMPKVTTEAARKALEEMARAMPFDPRAKLGG